MNKRQWKAYKNYLGKAYQHIDIQIENPNIFDFGSYAAILFKQEYNSTGLSDIGKKLLYLEKEGDQYRIVSESWYPLSRAILVKLAEVRKKTKDKRR